MNNEKLVKDDMILQVVKHFEMKFGKQSFRIKDYWDADLFAIGLSDSFKYLLYFSTWRQKDNKFYVAVETENISGHEPGELVEEFENVIPI